MTSFSGPEGLCYPSAKPSDDGRVVVVIFFYTFVLGLPALKRVYIIFHCNIICFGSLPYL